MCFFLCHRNNRVTRVPSSLNKLDLSQIEETEDHSFTIKLQIEFTLFFVILLKVFKISPIACLHYCKLVYSRRNIIACGITAGLCILIKNAWYYQLPGSIIIICDLITFLSGIYLFLNVNYTLIHFKRRSFVILWKVYNIIQLHIALYYFRYKINIVQFSDRVHFANTSDAICESILVASTSTIVVLGISLNHGYNISSKWKLLSIVGIVYFLMQYMMNRLANYNQEYIVVTRFPGQQGPMFISLRSMIISTCFDLIVWFVYQFYEIWRKPNIIKVVSEIRINWTE